MAFFIAIPSLIIFIAVLYLLTSFISNRVIGSLWVIVGAGWNLTTFALSKEEQMYWFLNGLVYFLIGLFILLQWTGISYLLWAFGILLFVIHDLIIFSNHKLVGFIVLIFSLLWIAFRKKNFIK